MKDSKKRKTKDLQLLHHTLTNNAIPSLEGAMYLSEGLYLLENGEIVEF